MDPSPEKDPIASSPIAQRLDALEVRLAEQARLIDRHIELIERRDSERRSWSLFWFVVGGHCLTNYLLLAVSEATDFPLYIGAITGSIFTLGVWHGLSFRPFAQRWHRTMLASAVGLVCARFVLDFELDSVANAIVIHAVFLLAPSIIAAFLISRWFRAGVLAPGQNAPAPRTLNLASVLCLSAVAALLLAVTRFSIGLIGSSAPSSEYLTLLYPTVAVGSAAAIAVAVLICGTWPKWWVALVAMIGCSVSLFLLNSAFVGLSRFADEPFSWAELQVGVTENVTSVAAVCLVEAAMPALTVFVLWMNGHQMRSGGVPTGENTT